MPTYKKNPVSNYYNITNPFENREKLQQMLRESSRKGRRRLEDCKETGLMAANGPLRAGATADFEC
jgi:hypothetical protein